MCVRDVEIAMYQSMLPKALCRDGERKFPARACIELKYGKAPEQGDTMLLQQHVVGHARAYDTMQKHEWK